MEGDRSDRRQLLVDEGDAFMAGVRVSEVETGAFWLVQRVSWSHGDGSTC